VAKNTLADGWSLGAALLRAPRRVGAIAPSGNALADAMAREIPGGDGIVIELGGGTGSVTAGLLRAGIAADRLVVVEQDKLLTGAWCVTGGCGPLIQFTYGLRCPATAALLAKSGARAQRRAWIWRNVPPASVWRLEIHASAEVNSEFDHVRHTP